MIGKGVPGAIRILGRDNILFDIMTKTNHPTFYVDAYPFWSIKFIILTKSGILYLLKTMYDHLEQVELQLDLRRQAFMVIEGLIVHMRVGEKRLSFEVRHEIV